MHLGGNDQRQACMEFFSTMTVLQATVHTTFLLQSGVQTLSHPAYSLDLAPSDFFYFSKTKDKIRGRVFESPEAAYEELLRNMWNVAYSAVENTLTRCKGKISFL